MRELTKIEVLAVKEKVMEIGMFENSATDNGFTPEYMLDAYPHMLNAKEWAEILWAEWMDDKYPYVSVYEKPFCIEKKHIKFCGKENVIKAFEKVIIKEFPYTDLSKSLEERKEIYASSWCF